MFKKIIIFIFVCCFAVLSYCIEQNDEAFINDWQNTGKKIASTISSIENEFSAKQAIPELQKLVKKFKGQIFEISSRQKASAVFRSRYAPEITYTMSYLKKALTKFNANDDIPLELREKISEILNFLSLKTN